MFDIGLLTLLPFIKYIKRSATPATPATPAIRNFSRGERVWKSLPKVMLMCSWCSTDGKEKVI